MPIGEFRGKMGPPKEDPMHETEDMRSLRLTLVVYVAIFAGKLIAYARPDSSGDEIPRLNSALQAGSHPLQRRGHDADLRLALTMS
jgi:hypothetical protein